MISGLYWKVRYYIRDKYITLKYTNKEPKIYYDKWLNEYICPANIRETGDVEYVASELVRCGLIYHYYLGDTLTHSHILADVMVEAYNNAETFKIYTGYDEYTDAHLELISKLVEKGKQDTIEWGNKSEFHRKKC